MSSAGFKINPEKGKPRYIEMEDEDPGKIL
jgi:hypothetical protein